MLQSASRGGLPSNATVCKQGWSTLQCYICKQGVVYPPMLHLQAGGGLPSNATVCKQGWSTLKFEYSLQAGVVGLLLLPHARSIQLTPSGNHVKAFGST
jgi:hypothetical protein